MTSGALDARAVFTGAQWIWTEPQGYDLVNYFMQARRAFTLPAVPRKCPVKITADSRYKLYVNGRYLCRGPARGFQRRWPYDELDMAPLLRRGANVIAALVHSYGHGTDQYMGEDAAGLIISGRAAPTDISTGPQWRVRRAPGYARHLTRASRELGFEEFFDARRDDGGWLKPSYDDSDWAAPHLTAAGAMPWHFAEERGIPMPAEEVLAPKAVLAWAAGRSARGWREAENLTANYLAEKRNWKRAAAKTTRSKTGLTFTAAPAGRRGFAAYLVDFGVEVVGSIGLEVTGARGGEVIDMQAAETLTGLAPDVDSPFVGCNVALCNRLTLAGGATSHEQFEPWGLRYLAVVVRETRRPLKIKAWLRTAVYPLDVKAAFSSSDAALNGIWAISVRAQECCMLDSHVDCPWREQAQWWGDARVQGANTFHLSADSRLFERGIRQIAAQEVPNGLTYGLTPSDMHHCILPDYTLTWIMTLWDHWWQTGEKRLVGEQAERAWRALGYFAAMTADNGLIPYDDRYWLFLDWADIFKDGYPTLYNIMYFYALETAARLFRMVKKTAYARECARRAAAVRGAIVEKLYDAKRGALYGGLSWKGRPVRAEDPHSYAMAVLCDLIPGRSARFAREKLLPLVASDNPKLTGDARGLPYAPLAAPSPFFMYYIFEALKKEGYRAEVIDCIRRWYAVFLDWGFTTTGENWVHVKGHTSACHAWSAHPIVHLTNIVLGVTQAAPGWDAIDFEPLLAPPGSARGKVATPHGVIEAAWEIAGGGAFVELALPRAVSAKVRLPGTRRSVKGGRHSWRVKT